MLEKKRRGGEGGRIKKRRWKGRKGRGRGVRTKKRRGGCPVCSAPVCNRGWKNGEQRSHRVRSRQVTLQGLL